MLKKYVLVIISVAFMGYAGLVMGADLKKGIDAFINKQYTTAFKELRPLAQQGNALAQFVLGFMYDDTVQDDTLQDDKQALYWYTKSAEQGNPSAQYTLGVRYAKGKGVIQDDKQAVYWLTKSAKQGNALAQYTLGNMYYTGKGVSKDYILAYVWLHIAKYNKNHMAKKAIGIVKKNMSSDDITTAQQMAHRCIHTGYNTCGYE